MITDRRAIGRAEGHQRAVSTWERAGAICGIAFAALLLVGFVLLDPVSGQSDQKFTEFYAERDNRIAVIAGMYLLAIAGGCFLWFLAALRRILRQAEGEPRHLSTLAYAAGIVFVTILFAGGAAMGVVATSMSLGGEPQPSPEIGRMFTQLGYTMILLFGMFAGIVMIAATSVVALRTGALPRWLSWAGLVAAVLLLIGVTFVSAIALPLWVAAVSVGLLRRGEDVRSMGQTAPSAA